MKKNLISLLLAKMARQQDRWKSLDGYINIIIQSPKNKAFAKKGKITKEEIPAVTQLLLRTGL